MNTSALPFKNHRIFWDVAIAKLDFEKDCCFIIERVFNRGDVEDIRACRNYYEEAIITNTLLNTKFLSLHKLYLASAVIDKPITAFKCYTSRQSMKEHMPY